MNFIPPRPSPRRLRTIVCGHSMTVSSIAEMIGRWEGREKMKGEGEGEREGEREKMEGRERESEGKEREREKMNGEKERR